MTPSRAVVVRAIVPQASDLGSTPSESRKSPRRAEFVRKAFRFFFAPRGTGSDFQSRPVSEPSAPMKFGSEAQTAARTGRSDRFTRT